MVVESCSDAEMSHDQAEEGRGEFYDAGGSESEHSEVRPPLQGSASPGAQEGEDGGIQASVAKNASRGYAASSSDDEAVAKASPAKKVKTKHFLPARVVAGIRTIAKRPNSQANSPSTPTRRRLRHKVPGPGAPSVDTSGTTHKVNPEDSIPCLMCGKCTKDCVS